MNDLSRFDAPFAQFLGIKLTHVSPERVEAELTVRKELATVPDILHGGAIMAFADNLGGTATTANLPPGARTSTIESKTNFFAPIPIGDTAHAECTPLHRGRSTMVWQTAHYPQRRAALRHRYADANRHSGRQAIRRARAR